MVKDRELHQTMLARQSRLLLRQMTDGLWEFMALLDLAELDADPIIDQMIAFVDFSNENSNTAADQKITFAETMSEEVREGSAKELKYYEPVRAMDEDILWLKLYFRKEK